METKWGEAERGRRGEGVGRKEEGDTQQRKAVRDGETRKERSDLDVSKPGGLDHLCFLIGRSGKRQNKRGHWESVGMGLGLSSRVGEPSGLLCFKIGIKQYYFGFHAEFLASGGGSEAQTQRETEMVQHSLILSTRPVETTWIEGAKTESISMVAQLHSA